MIINDDDWAVENLKNSEVDTYLKNNNKLMTVTTIIIIIIISLCESIKVIDYQNYLLITSFKIRYNNNNSDSN